MSNEIPTSGILKRSAQVMVDCTEQEAFQFISSSSKLPQWLKKVGAVPGAEKVDLLDESYNKVGQRRVITFQGGDTAQEQLLTYNPPGNYSYRISKFSNFLKKLSDAAYGQLWFDHVDGKTRITWEYSFTYKNIFARMALSLFLTLVYKKFMNTSLENARIEMEK
ncbi:MAG: SRPBCC family protein [Fluviicola sp.]